MHSVGDVSLAYEILISRGVAPMSSSDQFRDPFNKAAGGMGHEVEEFKIASLL